MKRWLVFLVGSFVASGLYADSATSNSVEIIWEAPTNFWPSSLWIYKVVPQHFSPAIISNLLVITSFNMSENLGTNGGWVYDKTDLNFETKDQKRHLWICQAYGYVEYVDSTARAESGRRSTGVPTDEEAYPLGLECLRKLGIDRSQLANRPSTNDFTGPLDFAIRRELGSQGWSDTNTQHVIEDVTDRGMYFVRQVDGVNIDGIVHGGVFISFGEHAKIAELKITWRGLEPFQLRSTITPAQIINDIRRGPVNWRPFHQMGPINQIRITGFEPFYRGQPGDADLETQQRFMSPYIVIYASLNDGGTNDVKCYSEMPIFPNR